MSKQYYVTLSTKEDGKQLQTSCVGPLVINEEMIDQLSLKDVVQIIEKETKCEEFYKIERQNILSNLKKEQ